MIRRLAGVFLRPRATLAEVIRQPAWATIWSVLLIAWAVCGAALLSTEVGRQALVDERVRMVEAFGGTVSDAQYAGWQANPPWWVYAVSGGRLLLTPPATLVAALGMWVVARADGARASLVQALALVVHATAVLALGQLIATPLHYVRESLTSPLNAAAVLPPVEAGSLPARFLGAIDLFTVWWAGLLAVSLSLLTGRRLGRYLWPLAVLYGTFAAVVAATIAVLEGA